MIFPSIQARTLQGQRLTVPQGLEAPLNLVVLAFWRDQQAQVDTWRNGTRALLARTPGLGFYELPVLEDRNLLRRAIIDGGMRLGIHDPAVRAHVITLYLHKEPFLQALEIPSDRTVYALLIDRSGRIHWRAEGLWSEEKLRDLEALLQPSEEAHPT